MLLDRVFKLDCNGLDWDSQVEYGCSEVVDLVIFHFGGIALVLEDEGQLGPLGYFFMVCL